jgi:hypothetical protein
VFSGCNACHPCNSNRQRRTLSRDRRPQYRSRRTRRGGQRAPVTPGPSDGDVDRPTLRVVGRIRAGDPTPAGVSATQRIEVEVRVTGLRQPAPARRTRDRCAATVSDGDRPDLGVCGMDHRGTSAARRTLSIEGRVNRASGPTLARHYGCGRAVSASEREQQGCGLVSVGRHEARNLALCPCSAPWPPRELVRLPPKWSDPAD